MRAWRWPARLVIVAVVVAAFVVDSRVDPPTIEDVTVAELRQPSPVPAVGALSSTWFCPVVQMSEDEIADGITSVLRVVNTGSETVPVTVTLVSSTSSEVVLRVEARAGAVTDIETAGIVDSDRLSAILEAPSGGIAVSRVMSSAYGDDIAPCAPGAGSTWTVAAGDTQRDSLERLVIFNPFPDDAVVDVLFATEVEAGAFQAADLRAIVVPGFDVTTVDLGEVVRRRDQVSVNLVARSGRVVVDRVQIFDNSEGRIGMAVALGSIVASERWYQPGVIVDAGTVANVHVHNPNDVAAEIDIAAESSVVFSTGDPIGLSVPAHDTVVIPVVATGTRDEGLRLEVDPGLPVGLLVESANGVPVVVEIELEVTRVEPPPAPTTTSTSTTTTTPTTTTTIPPTTAPESEDATTSTTTTTTTVPPTTTTTTTTLPPPIDPGPTLRDPRADAGLAHSLFIADLSRSWLLLGGSEADVLAAVLVHNPGPEPTDLVMSRLDGTLLDRFTILAGASLRVPLGLGIDAVVVEAGSEIAAAMTAERVGGVGVMLASGFPLL